MPNRLLDKKYLTKQFEIYNSTVFGVIVKDTLETLDTKVDKRDGFKLSKNDFTDELKTKLEGLGEYDDAKLFEDIGINADMIAVLKGDEETEGSVLHYVKNRFAQILAEAPEQFDTIREISEWIDNHTNKAANMKLAIDKNTEDIMAFKERWENYSVLVGEDEDLDFVTDDEFCRYEWVHVVPNSIKFVGEGSLTDNPSDYIVGLISSKQSVNGTVYDSEAITASLADVDIVGFSVNISKDRNMSTTKIEIVGVCAGSTSYEVGKVDTVIQEFHEWTHVDPDTLVFTGSELTDNLNDYTINSCVTKETEVGKSTTTEYVVTTLAALKEAGATVNVDVTDNGNGRKADVTISGVDITTSTYTGVTVDVENSFKDWYTVNAGSLVSLTPNLTDDESKYTVELVHHKQAIDNSVVHSNAVVVTLGEVESFGFDVSLVFTDNGNGRKADVTIGGVDISATSYRGVEESIAKTLSDWYSVVGSTITFTGNGDLTSDTEDYTVNVYTSAKSVDGTVTKDLSTKTLSELIDLGFAVSVDIETSLNNGAITKDSVVRISGVNIEAPNNYTGVSGTASKTITYHEWYDTDYPVNLRFTGSGDFTTNKSDYVLDIAYCKENASGTVYSNDPVSKTLAEADAAGLTTTLNVSKSNGGSTATITVSGAGISDNSEKYSSTVSTKTFVLHSWINVSDTVVYAGSGNDLTNSEDDYTVELKFYKEENSSSSIGTLYNTVNAKISEVENYGLTKSFSVNTEGCYEVDVSVSGVNIGSTTSYSSSVTEKSYALHEWIKLGSNSSLDLTAYDGNSYDNCTVSDVSKIVETTSAGDTRVLSSGNAMTVSAIRNNYANAEVSRSVGIDNGQYQITTTLTVSGMNLMSSSCINTVQTKVLTVKNYAVYAETANTLGSEVKYSGVVKWESDE